MKIGRKSKKIKNQKSKINLINYFYILFKFFYRFNSSIYKLNNLKIYNFFNNFNYT